MAAKVKPWVWIVVGVIVVGGLVVMAGVAAGAYFFARNIQARTVTHESAAAEFDGIRARFSTHKPLIELDERGHVLRTNIDREPAPGARRPESLYVLAFDPDDGGMVRVRVPFWLLRMKMNNPVVNLGSGNVSLDELKLTVEDLDRHGPALVLDQRNRGGDRVLVWTE